MKQENNKEYYIFPCNFDASGRFLGIIEYKTLALTAVWFAASIGLWYIIPGSVPIKIYGFIFTFFPAAIFLIIGINGDSVFGFVRYFIKFIRRSGVYTYNKDYGCEED